MGQPFFRFKQFTVHHDRCAMKVGMDGSLLGAWAGANATPHQILDIGTGTGLIALMLAQRFPHAHIDAIDIQETCLGQAEENVQASPFGDRIHLHKSPLQEWKSEVLYDLIVCNPPFFKNSSRSGLDERDKARHDDHLPFSELVNNAAGLLAEGGIFAVVIPQDRAAEFAEIASSCTLYLARNVGVRGRKGGLIKRRLLEYSNIPHFSPLEGDMAVEADVKVWTDEYASLLKDFYLKL